MASLADISRRAGTSVATASRVLNGSTHPVSEATRARVLEAAADLGYAPSALAQALVTRSSRIIGVIVNDIVDPYFAEIARGVEDVAGRDGLPRDGLQRRPPRSRPRSSTSARCATTTPRGWCSRAAARPAPARRTPSCERTWRPRASAARASSRSRSASSPALHVGVDNAAAAYDVTDYLISLGHRRIAFVEGPPGLYTSAERLSGFSAAMAAAGLDADCASPAASTSRRGWRPAAACSPAGRCPTPSSPPTTRRRSACSPASATPSVDVPGAGLGGGDRRHPPGAVRRAHDGQPAALRPRRRRGAPHPRGRGEPRTARARRTAWSRAGARAPRADGQW